MSKYTTDSDRAAITDVIALNKWVRICGDRAHLDVIFDDACQIPRTDGRHIWLPTFGSRTTKSDLHRARFFVLHECLHNSVGPEIFSENNELRGLPGHDPIVIISNIIEDVRIELTGSRHYPGDREVIRRGRELVGKDVLKNFEANPPIPDDNGAKLLAVQYEAWRAQAEWLASVGPLLPEYERLYRPFAGQHMDKLSGANIAHHMNRVTSVDSTIELAKRVFQLLWDKDPEEHMKEAKQANKDASEGEGKGQEGQAGGKHPRKDGKGKAGGSTRAGEQADADGKMFGNVPYEQVVISPHHGSAGAGCHIDYTNYSRGNGYAPVPSNSRKLDSQDETHLPAGVHGFINTVRRLLQVNTQAHYQHHLEKGRLSGRSMYRAGVPKIGDGKWNNRVFKHRIENAALDAAICLLVDGSGSMSGEKFQAASEAAALLDAVFDTALHIPTEISVFSTAEGSMNVRVKDYDEKVSAERVLGRMGSIGSRGANADADHVVEVYPRLAARKEKRKVLIVLSDGSPVSAQKGDPVEGLRLLIEDIYRNSPVEVYGIGIMDENVSRFYPHYRVIERPDQVIPALVDVVQEFLLKGDARLKRRKRR